MLGPFHRLHDLYVELPSADAGGVQFVQLVQLVQLVKESPKICLATAIQCSDWHPIVQPIEHLQRGLNMTRCKNVLAV
jgi:hypothetical protein